MAQNRESRFRNWFIEVNPSAKCFEDFKDIIEDIEETTEQYAYIKHNADTHEDGTPKLPHYHLVIELKNGRTFTSIKKQFEGAHIEICKHLKKAYQYLIHKNDKDKHQYNTNEIISNNIDNVKFIIENSNDFEIFNQEKCLDYILDGTTNYYLFYKRFGLDTCKQYWKAYQDLLKEWSLQNQDLIEDLNVIKGQRIEKELKDNGLSYEIEETGEMIEND